MTTSSNELVSDQLQFHICEQCGKRTPYREAAPHKRFCSGKCRTLWHQAQRKQAMIAYRKAISGGPNDQSK